MKEFKVIHVDLVATDWAHIIVSLRWIKSRHAAGKEASSSNPIQIIQWNIISPVTTMTIYLFIRTRSSRKQRPENVYVAACELVAGPMSKTDDFLSGISPQYLAHLPRGILWKCTVYVALRNGSLKYLTRFDWLHFFHVSWSLSFFHEYLRESTRHSSNSTALVRHTLAYMEPNLHILQFWIVVLRFQISFDRK